MKPGGSLLCSQQTMTTWASAIQSTTYTGYVYSGSVKSCLLFRLSLPGNTEWLCLNSSLGICQHETLPLLPSICLPSSWLPHLSKPDTKSASSSHSGVVPADTWGLLNDSVFATDGKCQEVDNWNVSVVPASDYEVGDRYTQNADSGPGTSPV
jgi:hypothetical protein